MVMMDSVCVCVCVCVLVCVWEQFISSAVCKMMVRLIVPISGKLSSYEYMIKDVRTHCLKFLPLKDRTLRAFKTFNHLANECTSLVCERKHSG